MKLVLEGTVDGSFVIGVAESQESAQRVVIERFHKVAEESHVLIHGNSFSFINGVHVPVKLYAVHYVEEDTDGDNSPNYRSMDTETDFLWGIYDVEPNLCIEGLTQEPFGFLELNANFPFTDHNQVEVIAEFEPRKVA